VCLRTPVQKSLPYERLHPKFITESSRRARQSVDDDGQCLRNPNKNVEVLSV
jgi:hypothetical protein